MIAETPIRRALVALGFVLAFGGVAEAACEGSEVPLAQYDNPGESAWQY